MSSTHFPILMNATGEVSKAEAVETVINNLEVVNMPWGLVVILVLTVVLFMWVSYRFGYARACAEAEAYNLGTYVSNDPFAVFKWRCMSCANRGEVKS